MFKRLFITALALLFCSFAFAQNQQDRWIWPDEHIEDALFLHIELGPKIGGGVALATNPSFFDFDLKGGLAYQIGGAINVNISHHPSLGLQGIGRLGFEIEALYGSRSFNAGNKNMVMRCLEIPLLLQYYITPDIQVEAGLTPVKLLGVSPDYLQTGNVVANVGNIKGNDMMVSAGACYKTDIGLTIGLRYNLGLSEWAENFHSKTSTAMVSVIYLFPLIK